MPAKALSVCILYVNVLTMHNTHLLYDILTVYNSVQTQLHIVPGFCGLLFSGCMCVWRAWPGDEVQISIDLRDSGQT